MAGYSIIPYYAGPTTTQEEREIAFEIGVPLWKRNNTQSHILTRLSTPELRLAGYTVSSSNSITYHRVIAGKFESASRPNPEVYEIRFNPTLTNPYTYVTIGILLGSKYNEYLYNDATNADSSYIPDYPLYSSLEEALDAMTTPIVKPVSIDYQGINTSFSGPETVDWGEEVSIDVTPGDGMVIQDPAQGKSISVYNENGYIPFVYANGKLTFTVPDAPNP